MGSRPALAQSRGEWVPRSPAPATGKRTCKGAQPGPVAWDIFLRGCGNQEKEGDKEKEKEGPGEQPSGERAGWPLKVRFPREELNKNLFS